jgi:ABC-type Zn uptake system ZnuABC Zn-binding protein ZnuA
MLAVCLVTGCGGSSESADEGEDLPVLAFDRSEDPWKVVVSMPIFADFARITGGDQVTVTTLIPAGEDPHTYEPPAEMAAAVQEADLAFVNGLGLDQPTYDFIEANHTGPLFLIDFVRNIPSPTAPQPVDRPVYAKDVGDDPHLFFDPLLVPVYAETVSHSLVIIDGINEPYYDALFAAYKAELTELHESITDTMQTVPAQNKDLLVLPHNSLVHFAARYGLGVAATLEEGEAAVQTALAQRRPPAVFTELGIDSEALEDAADEAGIKACELATDVAPEEDTAYIEMMEKLADDIARCLGA